MECRDPVPYGGPLDHGVIPAESPRVRLSSITIYCQDIASCCVTIVTLNSFECSSERWSLVIVVIATSIKLIRYRRAPRPVVFGLEEYVIRLIDSMLSQWMLSSHTNLLLDLRAFRVLLRPFLSPVNNTIRSSSSLTLLLSLWRWSDAAVDVHESGLEWSLPASGIAISRTVYTLREQRCSIVYWCNVL